jgi:hypothetical protein
VLVDVLGPIPQWKAIGFYRSSEKNDTRDRFFSPQERAQKRAEALAIKKAFPNLRYKVFFEDALTDEPIVTMEQPEQITGGDQPAQTEPDYPAQKESVDPRASDESSL